MVSPPLGPMGLYTHGAPFKPKHRRALCSEATAKLSAKVRAERNGRIYTTDTCFGCGGAKPAVCAADTKPAARHPAYAAICSRHSDDAPIADDARIAVSAYALA